MGITVFKSSLYFGVFGTSFSKSFPIFLFFILYSLILSTLPFLLCSGLNFFVLPTLEVSPLSLVLDIAGNPYIGKFNLNSVDVTLSDDDMLLLIFNFILNILVSIIMNILKKLSLTHL